MSGAARSSESHIESGLKMEPHGVFKEVTKLCTCQDHYQSVWHPEGTRRTRTLSGGGDACMSPISTSARPRPGTDSMPGADVLEICRACTPLGGREGGREGGEGGEGGTWRGGERVI